MSWRCKIGLHKWRQRTITDKYEEDENNFSVRITNYLWCDREGCSWEIPHVTNTEVLHYRELQT